MRHRFRNHFAILVLGFFLSSQAIASDTTLPNETYLHAAYCITIFQGILADEQNFRKSQVLSPENLQNALKWEQNQQAKIARLKSYILPHMAGQNSDEIFHIGAAQAQANEDLKQYNSGAYDGQCIQTCDKQADIQHCIKERCENDMPDFLKHIRRCSGIQNELPY